MVQLSFKTFQFQYFRLISLNLSKMFKFYFSIRVSLRKKEFGNRTKFSRMNDEFEPREDLTFTFLNNPNEKNALRAFINFRWINRLVVKMRRFALNLTNFFKPYSK